MIKIRQIKVNVTNDNRDVLIKKISSRLKISGDKIKKLDIVKKSVDARDKNNVLFNYEVNVELDNEEIVLKNNNKDVEIIFEESYKLPDCGKQKLKNRPIVVGAGPCGLFCALILAEKGFKPIVLERGEKVEDRVKTVDTFWNKNILNKESNVCFGEGGAGTFSDGKLNTLVNDSNSRIKKVFDTFVECGASDEIKYVNKPHIGTDVLRNVIVKLRNKIISLGGEFRYNNCLNDISMVDDHLVSVEVNNNEIQCDCLVLAIGHSARDTIEMLYNHNLDMSAKPFAIGVRVQHKQSLIDNNQYGRFCMYLPPASYKLTYKASNDRGVYSFCMCPGGYVVNSSCEDNHLIINGMSNNKRDSENANSAIVVTVGPSDFGDSPLDGVKFQRELEKKAFMLGNGLIPVQLLGDYINNRISKKFGSVNPVFKGNYVFADLNLLFPDYINKSLKESFSFFDKKIRGFADDDVILAGVESRTSSAVRIERNEKFVSNIYGIYPSGEGAGYSGGITTSAIDGIKVAEKIIEKYSNEL